MPFVDVTLISWNVIISIVGLAAMGFDKLSAARGWSRISERTLIVISLIGGVWGIVIGAYLFHHKTSKPGFMILAYLILAFWIFVTLRPSRLYRF